MANVTEFLDAYFGGYAAKEKTRQFNAQQAHAQSVLDSENQRHSEDMSARMAQMQQQDEWHKASEAHANAQEERMKRQEEAASQAAFESKGGFPIPTPQDKQTSTTMGGNTPQLPDMSMFGIRPSTQPVGPLPEQAGMPSQAGLASGQELANPPQMPAAPTTLNATVPGNFQGPSVDYATPSAGPMKTEPGMSYFKKTPAQLAYENKAAINEANQMEVTPELAASLPELHLTPNTFMDARHIPLAIAHLQYLQSANEKAREFGLKEADSISEKEKDRNLRLALAQLTAANKDKKGLEPEELEANHKSVMDNPDSFASLRPEEKTKERVKLQAEGLPAPTPAGPEQLRTENFARRAINSISTVRDLLSNPKTADIIKKRTGMALGRLGDLEQLAGDTSGLTDEESRVLQNFRSSVRYLTFQEGKSLFGSRIPIQLMKELQQTSPRTTESLALLQGSMDGVKRNAEDALVGGYTSRFGGGGNVPKPVMDQFLKRNNIGGGAPQEVEVPNFPAAVASKLPDGVTKSFERKDGTHNYIRHGDKVYEVVRK